jgi:endonuclease/exonuclease/phosphatase family metal-dependent hydrolase
VFTEVTDGGAFEAIASGIGPHCVEARRDREHVAVVSRWPIERSAKYGPPWAPEKWIEATVRPFGGSALTVHGVHLVPQPLWPCELLRIWEVRRLTRHVTSRDDGRHIIAGDFNGLAPGDSQKRDGAPMWIRAQWWAQGGGTPRWALRAVWQAGLVDCFRACNAHKNGYTVPAWDPSARIDYIFASPDLESLLRASETPEPPPDRAVRPAPGRSMAELLGRQPVRSLGGPASDHLPVYADFEWDYAGE